MKKMVAVFCMTFSIICLQEIQHLPDGALHVHVLDVGQGDCILLRTPHGATIVVDGGPDLSALSELPKHLPYLDQTIDLLVLTHADADHITALPELLRRYHVRRILLSGAIHSSRRYAELIDTISQTSTPIFIAHPKTDIVFSDGVRIDTVWPTIDTVSLGSYSPNDTSVVLRVLYREHSVLLTGDIEQGAEHAILQSGADVSTTILKVAHHGSRTSTSTGFLLATSPGTALISSGKENRYGHPHHEVLNRLTAHNITIKNTADEGGISLVLR